MSRLSKTFLVFFLTFIFFQLSAKIVPAQVTSCVITKVGNPAGQAVLPPECQANISGDARSLAQQILANKNINLSAPAKEDIQAVIDGRLIQNSSSCGNAVTVDPALLKVFLQLAQTYKYSVWNIVSEHGCDQWQHPKGKGTDIGWDSISGPGGIPGFRKAAYDVLPAGANLLMGDCPGSGGFFRYRPQIGEGHDSSNKCNHQHIDVR